MKSSNTTSTKLFGSLCAALVGLLSISAAHAQVLYSNLGDSGYTTSGLTPDSSYASEFTTGSAETIITAASASIAGAYDTPQTLTLSLYTNSVDVPGTSLGSFTAATVPGGYGVGTFGGTNTGLELQANTTYWLIESSGGLFAEGTPSSAVDPGSVFTSTPGAELGVNFGSGWETSGVTGYLRFTLTGADVVPEPSTWVLLLGGLGLLAFWHKRTRSRA